MHSFIPSSLKAKIPHLLDGEDAIIQLSRPEIAKDDVFNKTGQQSRANTRHLTSSPRLRPKSKSAYFKSL